MRRKLIKQGGGGLTVYLPKRWTDTHGLDAGGTVEIVEKGTSLRITPEQSSKKSATIDITGDPEAFVRTKIMNHYRLGYDRLEVAYGAPNERAFLLTLVEGLLGYALTGERKGVAIIESISEPSTERYEPILLRIFYILKELLDAVESGADTSALATEAYRNDNFCRRAISKGVFQEERIPIYWAFHLQLIHAVRDIRPLNERRRKSLSQNAKSVLGVAREILALLQESYAKREPKRLLAVYARRDKALARAKFAPSDAIVVHHLLVLTNDLYLAASPLYAILTE